jgi:hypothetical protein
MKYIIFIILAATLVLAAPPSLSNHQFFGDVIWNGTQLKSEVKATIGGNEYTSNIEDGLCTAGECSGRYGISQNNILRVQGDNGDTITFFIDGEEVTTHIYKKDSHTELDLNLILAEQSLACIPDWNCTLLECVDSFREKTCVDLNSCNATYVENITCTVNQTEEPEEASGSVDDPISVTNCDYQWQCSTYSTCLNGLKSRTCSRVDTCDLQYSANPDAINVIAKPKPSETEACFVPSDPDLQQPEPVESCFDNVKNQNEDEVDCGGICPNCPGIPWYYWGGPLIAIILIGLGVGGYFLLGKRGPPLSPQKQQQLKNYFRTGMARGMSKDQIKDNLIKSGWKSGDVKKGMKEL